MNAVYNLTQWLIKKSGEVPNDFDWKLYLKLNPDIANSSIDPTLHYYAYGKDQGRLYRSPKLLKCEKEINPLLETVLIISHDASRTGAPILALNIGNKLSEKYNVIFLLLGDGPISENFKESSVGLIIEKNIKNNNSLSTVIFQDLAKRFEIKYAIVNTVESISVLPYLSKLEIPTTVLVHEFASCYSEPLSLLKFIFKWSSHVIFSTKLTLSDAKYHYKKLPLEFTSVLPQGRCSIPATLKSKEAFDIEQSNIKNIVRPREFAKDTIVIIGVGYIQYRKGIDLFVDVASKIIDASPNKNIRFVWIGGGYYDPKHNVGYPKYLADQLIRSGLEDKLFFVGDTSAIEVAYSEADILLLTSRLDPLPHVAIEAMDHQLPVLCFDKTTGIVDFLDANNLVNDCVCRYLDTNDMAEKALKIIKNPKKLRTLGQKSSNAAMKFFNMDDYINRLDTAASSAIKRINQDNEDAKLILSSGLLNYDGKSQLMEGSDGGIEIVKKYIREWKSSDGNRKPYSGFHPGIYEENHGLSIPGADPFADFLRAGKPKGKWTYEVINDQYNENIAITSRHKTALHIHAHYPELLEEIIWRIKKNKTKIDIFISVTCQEAEDKCVKICNELDLKIFKIKVLPNVGRDIGPMISWFLPETYFHYDFVGHVHTKKSPHANKDIILKWNNFLLENMLGGSSNAMIDKILTALSKDPLLGLIFPDDPNAIGWDKNKDIAIKLMNRINVFKLPECFNFPVGNMFWARSTALEALMNLKLDREDYPMEPLPLDGTLLHAMERLLPFQVELNGYKTSTTNVSIVSR